MESPPPAVFHDKYERTQQGNLLGSTVKNLTLTFLPQIFLGVHIYVEGPTFHQGTSKLTVTVTITVTVTVTGVRWTFQELTKFHKIIFLN